jgi:hypothetical protein
VRERAELGKQYVKGAGGIGDLGDHRDVDERYQLGAKSVPAAERFRGTVGSNGRFHRFQPLSFILGPSASATCFNGEVICHEFEAT